MLNHSTAQGITGDRIYLGPRALLSLWRVCWGSSVRERTADTDFCDGEPASGLGLPWLYSPTTLSQLRLAMSALGPTWWKWVPAGSGAMKTLEREPGCPLYVGPCKGAVVLHLVLGPGKCWWSLRNQGEGGRGVLLLYHLRSYPHMTYHQETMNHPVPSYHVRQSALLQPQPQPCPQSLHHPDYHPIVQAHLRQRSGLKAIKRWKIRVNRTPQEDTLYGPPHSYSTVQGRSRSLTDAQCRQQAISKPHCQMPTPLTIFKVTPNF